MADRRTDERNASDEEKQPINSVEGKEGNNAAGGTDVKVRRPRRTGCFCTNGQAVALAVSFFVVVALVGLVTAILTRMHWCPCKTGQSSLSSGLAGPKPTVAPGYPWSDIRIPKDLVPSYYDLELRVDLDKFVFSGSVDIHIEVKRSTAYIIIHSYSLNISQADVMVQDLKSKKVWPVKRHVLVPINQFHVLEMEDYLDFGAKYLVRFGKFTGLLQDDLRGLYKSSYRTLTGEIR